MRYKTLGNSGLLVSEIKLTKEDMERLDKVSELPSEYPGWMVTRTSANRMPS